MSNNSGGQPHHDGRRLYRLTFDILALPSQLDRVMELMKEALCDGPDDHQGPCNIAWTATSSTSESLMDGHFTAADLRELREELEVIDVHPAHHVNEVGRLTRRGFPS